ncbi:MAG: FxDxF family PEP-CTERM protein [Aquabacterium sp.]|nr:FxDxF family PEP-CTERM protein [Aquabacterium sp.]
MNTLTRLAAVALTAVAMVSSAQAKTDSLGTLTSTGTTFGNTFYTNVTSFTDYYTFSIADPGTVSGTTVDTSYILFFTKDVVLDSLTLTAGGSSTVIQKDTSANSFTFSGLAAGNYTMAVTGSVSGLFSSYGSYSGTIKAVSSPVSSAAPEPADLALTLVGLAGVGYMVRRRAAR